MTDFRFADINDALPRLANHLLNEGQELGSRAGRVKEVLHNHIAIEHPWRREVLVPGRKASLPAQIAETMWVLAGRSDVEFLSHYLPRAADFSDDGVVWRGGYGPRLRGGVDQLEKVVQLLANDRSSRRAVVGIFDGQEDWVDSKDIPCNDLLVFSSRLGRLDLSVHVRSNDLVWGFSGINQFEWSALQEIVAGLLGVSVGCTHYHTVSLHIYDRHWSKAASWGLDRVWSAAKDSPRFSLEMAPDGALPLDRLAWFDELVLQWFYIEKNLRTGTYTTAEAERAIASLPEPMLRSWLHVLNAWWNGTELPPELADTALAQAYAYTPKSMRQQDVSLVEPVAPEAVAVRSPALRFAAELAKLHAEKSAAYGDSWKRRGELLGILANIARKVDRLGVTDGNETSADTAADLLIYIVKYRLWLETQHRQDDLSDNPVIVKLRLEALAPTVFVSTELALSTELMARFEYLFAAVQAGDRKLVDAIVGRMEIRAWELAFILWTRDQEAAAPAPSSGNPYRVIAATDDFQL